MPYHYAHYRFGEEVLAQMPGELQRRVRRFLRLYRMGQQGPDLLEYHSLLLADSDGVALSKDFHGLSGGDFFSRACGIYRNNPSEGALACLLGLLGHYCLDSAFREVMAEKTAPDRRELAVEFDRYLLCKDGKLPPHTQDLGGKLPLTLGECVTLASFYPPVKPGAVHASRKNMTLVMRLMAMKNRKFLQGLLKLFPGSLAGRQMAIPANHRFLHLNGQMETLYASALEAWPMLLDRLLAHLETGAPLGEEFDGPFC